MSKQTKTNTTKKWVYDAKKDWTNSLFLDFDDSSCPVAEFIQEWRHENGLSDFPTHATIISVDEQVKFSPGLRTPHEEPNLTPALTYSSFHISHCLFCLYLFLPSSSTHFASSLASLFRSFILQTTKIHR